MSELSIIDKLDNPAGIGIVSGVGGAILGGSAVAAYNYSKNRRRKKSSHRGSRARTVRHRKRKHKRVRHHPHTAGKRKDTSRRRIRYTKKGQPYVIGRNGKARFVKKSSARRSHKLKGGRY